MAGLTVGAFAICALAGATVRAVHYGFGVNAQNIVVVRPPPMAPSARGMDPRIGITGYVTRPHCTLTLYADEAPIASATPPPLPARFTFSLPQSLWETQNQILARCPLPSFPFVSRALVAVPVPKNLDVSGNALFRGVARAVHFWISPGRTNFYGVLELSGDEPRLTSALELSSLDQLAREAFNINFNFHPLYDALRSPTPQLYESNHHLFLTLRGELYPYATVAGSSRINIVVSPIELVRAACVRHDAFATGFECNSDPPANENSKVVVRLRGLNATSFPSDTLGISRSLGPPNHLDRDGSYVWYTSVAAPTPQSVQIDVHGYALSSPGEVHHFLAAEAKGDTPLLQVIVDAVHALIGVVIVAILLVYAGFWKHDVEHERYCGIITAAALASVLVDAGSWLARYGFYIFVNGRGLQPAEQRNVSFLLGYLRPTFVAAELAALIAIVAIVWALRHWKVTSNVGYFLGTALAILTISFLGSLYSAVELHQHYLSLSNPNNLNSSLLTIASNAILAVVMFVLLMVSFRPELAMQLFGVARSLRPWVYWLVVSLMTLSAVVVAPSSAYFAGNYSAPEFRIDMVVMEAGNYISGLAVVVPILWFLCSRNRAIVKTAKHKGHLALLFAVLVVLTGYAYLGFPVTLLLTFAAIYWIALRPNRDYEAISANLNSGRTREDLLAEAYDIDMCAAARQTKERFLSQFVSGNSTWDDYKKREAELDAFISSRETSSQDGTRAHATELAFGMGLENDLVSNARFTALISLAPASILTALAAQAVIGNASAAHAPFFVAFAQVVSSVIGYMAAGLGFGLVYPYVRGKVGTMKALWIILALALSILPYEFMSGSRPDYLAQILRWLIFFGGLGVTTDVLSAVRWKRRLNVRDLIGIVGVGHFAAVGAVAVTIATSLLTSESRDLLQVAIHHVVPAQYALPTPQDPGE